MKITMVMEFWIRFEDDTFDKELICITHGNVRIVAEAISKANPRRVVQVEAMNYLRISFKDGEVVNDYPNLDNHYSNLTENQLDSWKRIKAA